MSACLAYLLQLLLLLGRMKSGEGERSVKETPVVLFEDVWFAYDTTPVLEDVSFSVKGREFFAVVGPNGGGKTTLLKLILGLLEPTRGTVRVFGETPVQARRRIGYVPQHAKFDPAFPIRVLDVVLMGRLGKGGFFCRRADIEAVERALDETNASELKHRLFRDLSGGQRQRVLIARALATEPELLLLDEPAAHLDVSVERRFYQLLAELNRRLTIVIVSHSIGFVSRFVTGVLCVNRRAVTHPTCEILDEGIKEMYGEDFRIIRHDHTFD